MLKFLFWDSQIDLCLFGTKWFSIWTVWTRKLFLSVWFFYHFINFFFNSVHSFFKFSTSTQDLYRDKFFQDQQNYENLGPIRTGQPLGLTIHESMGKNFESDPFFVEIFIYFLKLRQNFFKTHFETYKSGFGFFFSK